MSVVLSLAFPLITGTGPMNEALQATEAPEALRAAFTVEMTSAKASRTYTFDPREPDGRRWRLILASGEDSDLDQAAAAWGAEIAPDGRLFPDDLRASFGEEVFVDDLGPAWRLKFQHAPSANDNALDIWAAQRLQAEDREDTRHDIQDRLHATAPRSRAEWRTSDKVRTVLLARDGAGMGSDLYFAIRARI